jgi:HEAT repeat protein
LFTDARINTMPTFRKSSFCLIVLATLAAGVSCRPPSAPQTGYTSGPADAVLSPDPQRWADALYAFANDSQMVRTVPTLTAALSNPSVTVRKRAAMALGAIGELSRPAVPALLLALADPDTGVRSEVAFAIGSVGERSEHVLQALFRASAEERSPLVKKRLSSAVSSFSRRSRLAVSPQFASELRSQLSSAEYTRRSAALEIAERTNVPWGIREYLRLLGDPEPDMRYEAAWALVALGDTSSAVRTAIAHLADDSVKWVGDDVASMLAEITNWSEPRGICRHRVNEGLIAAEAEVDPSSISLRSDGKGPYAQNRDGVNASQSYAFNLLLANAVDRSVPTIGKQRASQGINVRTLAFDLSDTVPGSGSVPLGSIRDSAATFHVFYMWDKHRLIWNTRDLPVGAKVESSRSQFNVTIDGRPHRLQFGPWALGDCKEGYATSGAINGAGTSPVWLARVSEHEYLVTAPAGSIARLWDYSAPAAKDRGLYRFSFALRIRNVSQ